ncbi:ATP-binding protein [hot springs metagenome]|uniref:ATP-binding protein n=1 Tax=hot springs metagenome TaxID=433727 RepID=A0A5J4L2Q3_9ZZZZ
MNIFANRKSELHTLESEYAKESAQFVVIYGRRRIGKTTLIKEFLKNKPYIYFLADRQIEIELIDRFRDVVSEYLKYPHIKEIDFKTWDSIIDYWIRHSDFSTKVVVVIDEFQYIARVNSAFPSILQRIWDEKLKSKNIMLILCGSLINMMYSTTLSYNSPLYGRRTGQLKVEPISFNAFSEFFPNLRTERLIEFYSVIGGVPKYMEIFNPKKDVFHNIREYILNKTGYLYAEPRFILSDELTETTTYFSILKTIAQGERKMGNIAARLMTPTQNLTGYFNVLIDLDILERRVPVTEEMPEKSKMGLYFIKDNFFRFWFRYVFANQNYLELENTDYVLQKIKDDFDEFVSITFEDIAPYILFSKEMIKKLPFEPDKWGRWWDRNDEIDLIALNKKEKKALFVECKWSKRPVDVDVMENLKRKANRVEWFKEKRKDYFAIISRKGFTKRLHDYSEKYGVILISIS